jgi:hypothetical protein
MPFAALSQAARRAGAKTARVACSVVVPTGKPRLIRWSKAAPAVSFPVLP